jgi:hypothetical protein
MFYYPHLECSLLIIAIADIDREKKRIFSISCSALYVLEWMDDGHLFCSQLDMK